MSYSLAGGGCPRARTEETEMHEEEIFEVAVEEASAAVADHTHTFVQTEDASNE
jgi:hypothetical protein